jgi:hypothetical protein
LASFVADAVGPAAGLRTTWEEREHRVSTLDATHPSHLDSTPRQGGVQKGRFAR